MRQTSFPIFASRFFACFLLALAGCGIKLVRERPMEPKSQSIRVYPSEEETRTDNPSPFGAHLMGKSEEQILALLGPPAKRHKGIEKGKEEWYYSQPHKAKLYFKNGKVNWWNLTEESKEKAAAGGRKNKENAQKHPRIFPHENTR